MSSLGRMNDRAPNPRVVDFNRFCSQTKALFSSLGVEHTVYELDLMSESGSMSFRVLKIVALNILSAIFLLKRDVIAGNNWRKKSFPRCYPISTVSVCIREIIWYVYTVFAFKGMGVGVGIGATTSAERQCHASLFST